jgi:hypothetical protein
MTEKAGPGSELTFDYLSGEEEFPHLKTFWRNVRKGGPKEKRLRKVISMIPDTRKDEMICLRLENVYTFTPSEVLYDAFSEFGEIGDFFRPTNTQTMLPTQYCFIRYMEEGSALTALAEMDDKKFGGYSNGGIWDETSIKVKRAIQDHFFTQDTGYITNEALDSIVVQAKVFDSSMPTSHYSTKRAEAIKYNDEVFTLKVSDIPAQITPEMLWKLFGSYGEVSNIYTPMDLKTRRFRDFAFVRFPDRQCAVRAWKDLDDVNLGVGRNIRVQKSFPCQYFGMDETPS